MMFKRAAVELRLNDDDLVDAVTLDTRQGDEEGVVVQIRTTHTPRITIEDDRGRKTPILLLMTSW